MALLDGLGGGITRDVLLNKIPGALTNPAYITVCLVAGVIGYWLAFAKGRCSVRACSSSRYPFSLPWYARRPGRGNRRAARRRHPGHRGDRPNRGALLHRHHQRVPPKQFIRGEWFVSIALLTGAIWLVCYAAGLGTWASAGISFAIGFRPRPYRPVPGLGGAAGQGAGRCLPAPTVGRCSDASSRASRYVRCATWGSSPRTPTRPPLGTRRPGVPSEARIPSGRAALVRLAGRGGCRPRPRPPHPFPPAAEHRVLLLGQLRVG